MTFALVPVDWANMQLVAILAIVLALAFDFVNGFHDTANAVATVIHTKALKPRVAIVMSGTLNFLGAIFVGTAVAKVITKIIPHDKVSLLIVVSVLVAALIWNILTWWKALPVSSSHCLIGALFGAGVAANGIDGVSWGELTKVSLALIISPVAGFACGALVTWVSELVFKRFNNLQVLRFMQVLSSCSVNFVHGSNDGQKTMGIITLILATEFAYAGYTMKTVPLWVMIAAAGAIGIGTMIGGGRIIRTVGERIAQERIAYTQGFAAESSTALLVLGASLIGAPISTTHTLTSAVAGGTVPVHGADKLNLSMIKSILLAWVLTLPVVAVLSASIYTALHHIGR